MLKIILFLATCLVAGLLAGSTISEAAKPSCHGKNCITTTVTTPTTTTPTTTTTLPPANLFSDEFAGSSLDTSKWWATPWCSTSGDDSFGCYDVDNAFVSNGNLVLRVSNGTNGRTYDFARVQTFREGGWPPPQILKSWAPPVRVEASIKFAAGAGVWGGFWPMGTNSPNPVEFDVQEQRGAVPTQVACHIHNVGEYSGTKDAGMDLSQSFHTYTLDYYTSHVVFKWDGKICGDFPVAVSQDIGIRFSNAVGPVGSWGGIGGPPPASAIPADMLVDYVRVTRLP